MPFFWRRWQSGYSNEVGVQRIAYIAILCAFLPHKGTGAGKMIYMLDICGMIWKKALIIWYDEV